MKALVCGGREYSDYPTLARTLNSIHQDNPDNPITTLIHGAARGADSLAGRWAKTAGVPVREVPVDWNNHGQKCGNCCGSGRCCRRAGFLRNEQMLRCGQPDRVIPWDPIKLSYIPTEPVISIITPWAIVTIVALVGDGQMVYDVLSLPNIFIKNLAIQYAEHYLQESVMDFALNAMSNEQIRNVEQNTGVNLPLDDQDR